jgi:hypothetical protein
MKGLLVLVILGVAGWFAYQKYFAGGGPPATFENPVYGEMRVVARIQSRELEMAAFVRAADDEDCRTRGSRSWNEVLAACPTCTRQPVKCHEQLPPRYARLFDDVPIASTYLSATAGNRSERDGRVVFYGLTDAEGAQVCELFRAQFSKQYAGTMQCVTASGG